MSWQEGYLGDFAVDEISDQLPDAIGLYVRWRRFESSRPFGIALDLHSIAAYRLGPLGRYYTCGVDLIGSRRSSLFRHCILVAGSSWLNGVDMLGLERPLQVERFLRRLRLTRRVVSVG